MIKYSVDEYGNVYSTYAQIEPVRRTVCYNPEKETLETPPEIIEGKRLLLENGIWEQIDIPKEHIKENGKIRAKNQLELYRDGINEIPKGFKIINDDNELRLEEKTLEEKLNTNEITQEEYYLIKLNIWEKEIKNAYYIEADPLFFKSERGEIDKQIWLDKIEEIRLRFPKPRFIKN